jgi:hypothetical protein
MDARRQDQDMGLQVLILADMTWDKNHGYLIDGLSQSWLL